jgi:ABC-2 type transport system ATP-binding protein
MLHVAPLRHAPFATGLSASLMALAVAALTACGAATDETALSGYAEADLVYLASSIAGTLQTLHARRGDAVKAGQVLYALDSDAEALSRDAAQARSERALAQADNLRKGKRPLELAALDEQLAQARAALAGSAAALARQQTLVQQGYVSPLRLEELTAARDRDAARVKELQAQRRLADEAARRDEVAAAAAEARGAGADLALARWREDQKQRRAPTDATVHDVMYRAGEWVSAGAPVLALLPARAIKVRFFVPQDQLPRAAVGAELALACDGCPQGLTARLRWVSTQAEFTPPVIYSIGSRSKLVFMAEAEPGDANLAAARPAAGRALQGGTVSEPDFAIDVRGLTKRFGGRTVVDDVAIRVQRGEICGFLGPNGSGKTTTIRMLCGLLEPDAGEGQCLGLDIRRDARRIKRRVGYMTQRFGLYEDLSIQENLDFVARAYGMANRPALVRDAIGRLGLEARSRQLAGTLSGGWKQRLALAACMLHEPELLLLDEPTAGVDPKARRDFWQQIHALAASGLTVLVSTHYMDEAERCHRLAYISYGKLLATGTAEDVVQHAALQTWELRGPRLGDAMRLLQSDARWMVVPFGTAVHVSAPRGADLLPWLAAQAPAAPWTVTPIATGLEDVFIALTAHAQDNFA